MTDMTLGKYRILAEIGKGGFATVYRALDTTLDREVALKVLDPILARDPAWVARFQREAKVIARLKHPHIVTIYEVGESEGRLYIAMELIDGPSLAQQIGEHGRLPWEEALATLGQVADALDYAHGQGVLHRDLKPGNILLDPQRGAILTDFGFARLVGESSMSVSLSGGVVGTPAYIAPEVWDGEEPTAQTDIYSLGCVAYEMLTGEVLFAGKTPSVLMRQHLMDGPQLPEKWPEGMPAGIRDILARAVMKDPAARYASAREFTAAFAASRLPVRATSALAPVTTRATPVDKTEQDAANIQPPPVAARRRWPILAGATVGMVVLLAIIWTLTRSPASIPVARSTATALPTAPEPAAAQAEPTTAAQQPTSPAPVAPPASATSAPTATPTEMATLTPTATPTARSTRTATPTPGPAFTVKEGSSVNVRSGPGTVYPVIGALQAGETRKVTGRTATGDWWKFDYNGKSGWVSGQVVTANAASGQVAVVSAPPTPGLTATAVPLGIPSGTVRGRVLWNEQPVQGATVYVTELYRFDSTQYGSASTDANGRFSIPGIPEGQKYLYVFGNGPEYWVSVVTPFRMMAGTGTSAEDTYLCKGFNPILPQDGEVIHVRQPILQWNTYPGAVDYAVRVIRKGEDNFAFQRGDYDAHITGTSVKVGVELIPGEYGWRVDAFNAASHIIACSYYPRSFTVAD